MGKTKQVLAGAFFVLILAGCGDAGLNSTKLPASESCDTHQGCSLKLAWDAPQTKVNGDPITEPLGYTVAWGRESGNYTDTLDAGQSTQATVRGLGLGVYHLAVRAYYVADPTNSSAYSTEISNSPLMETSF